jgi:transcriptional regulator GlxA family with amidase domain
MVTEICELDSARGVDLHGNLWTRLIGIVERRKVATHWRFAADLAKRYPKLRVNPSSLYVKDGKFWTAAGVTAGIDLSLALIEEDFGSEVALRKWRFWSRASSSCT